MKEFLLQVNADPAFTDDELAEKVADVVGGTFGHENVVVSGPAPTPEPTVTDDDRQRFIDSFLSIDIDIEYVRLAKLDTLRRPTLNERYLVAREWLDRWTAAMATLNRTMQATLDSITPLPRQGPLPGESIEEYHQMLRSTRPTWGRT